MAQAMAYLHDLLADPNTVLKIAPHEYGEITRDFLIADRKNPEKGKSGLVHAPLCMIREYPTCR